ncbi:hypothetical protein AC249_AIPGENE25029 [Exaiptasia diaphana]|nr:hypothetical protein AC249_AIPGENE25029 [Exaiptasia diaphana]
MAAFHKKFEVIYLVLTALKALDCMEVGWTIPSSVHGKEGESVTIAWQADLSSFSAPDDVWSYVKVYQKQENRVDELMIKLSKSGVRTVYPKFVGRDSDLKLHVYQKGSVVKILLSIASIDETSDAREYTVLLGQSENSEMATKYTKLVIQDSKHEL